MKLGGLWHGVGAKAMQEHGERLIRGCADEPDSLSRLRRLLWPHVDSQALTAEFLQGKLSAMALLLCGIPDGRQDDYPGKLRRLLQQIEEAGEDRRLYSRLFRREIDTLIGDPWEADLEESTRAEGYRHECAAEISTRVQAWPPFFAKLQAFLSKSWQQLPPDLDELRNLARLLSVAKGCVGVEEVNRRGAAVGPNMSLALEYSKKLRWELLETLDERHFARRPLILVDLAAGATDRPRAGRLLDRLLGRALDLDVEGWAVVEMLEDTRLNALALQDNLFRAIADPRREVSQAALRLLPPDRLAVLPPAAIRRHLKERYRPAVEAIMRLGSAGQEALLSWIYWRRVDLDDLPEKLIAELPTQTICQLGEDADEVSAWLLPRGRRGHLALIRWLADGGAEDLYEMSPEELLAILHRDALDAAPLSDLAWLTPAKGLGRCLARSKHTDRELVIELRQSRRPLWRMTLIEALGRRGRDQLSLGDGPFEKYYETIWLAWLGEEEALTDLRQRLQRDGCPESEIQLSAEDWQLYPRILEERLPGCQLTTWLGELAALMQNYIENDPDHGMEEEQFVACLGVLCRHLKGRDLVPWFEKASDCDLETILEGFDLDAWRAYLGLIPREDPIRFKDRLWTLSNAETIPESILRKLWPELLEGMALLNAEDQKEVLDYVQETRIGPELLRAAARSQRNEAIGSRVARYLTEQRFDDEEAEPLASALSKLEYLDESELSPVEISALEAAKRRRGIFLSR